MPTVTVGRNPTLGEVIGYYTRDDFSRYLLDTLPVRPVVLVLPAKLHWEPNWPRDEVQAENAEELRAFVQAQIAEHLPGVALDERPPFYPSFHQAVWTRSLDGDTSEPDCFFEADLPTWRDAFGDVRPLLELMEDHGVYYQHKFSGHRSLHVAIPSGALPRGYRGKNLVKLIRRLFTWSRSQAHRLPRITRMPYSLNEDTGLVCLPIERGDLGAFRPWQANLHLVEVRDIWQDDVYPEADIDGLVSALGAGDPSTLTVERRFFAVDAARIRARYRGRIQGYGGAGPTGRAWRLLAGGQPLTEGALLDGLASDEPDARWLTAEAYLLHGTALSERGFSALLAQNEEYVEPSAVDVLLRFEDEILPHLVERIAQLEQLPDQGLRAAYLLTQSDSLRDGVLETLIQGVRAWGTDEDTMLHDARIVSACLLGSMIGDWSRAFGLLEGTREAQDLTERDRTRLAALDLMSTFGGWDKREEAAKAQRLAEMGPAVTDLLLLAAGSADRRLRRGVVSALAGQADPRAIHLLIYALNDDYTEVRRKAISGLIRIGEPAVDALIEAAASDQVRLRRYAVHCLGSIGAARGKRAVIEALHDAEEVVRKQAVRALQKNATIEDLEHLVSFLRKALPGNAIGAVEVLESLGETGAQALREMARSERNLAAATFLARQGEDWGREILVEALADSVRREAAVEFLRELRDECCVPYLVEQLRASTDWHGSFLGHELGHIGGDRAVAALIEASSREQVLIRRGAIRGLGETRDPAAIEPLIERIAQDTDSKVRKYAAEALLSIGPAAVGPMRRALVENRFLGRHRQSLIAETLSKLGAEP